MKRTLILLMSAIMSAALIITLSPIANASEELVASEYIKNIAEAGKKQTTGTLIIKNTTSNVFVTIDGGFIGTASFVFDNIKPGEHTVKGFKRGNQIFESVIYVDAEENTFLTIYDDHCTSGRAAPY